MVAPKDVFVLFPINLYRDIREIELCKVFLVEEPIYFDRSADKLPLHFNQLKPIYHRATMQYYYDYLRDKSIDVTYVELKYQKGIITNNWINIVDEYLDKHNDPTICVNFYDPVDHVVEKKIKSFNNYRIIDTPGHILSYQDMLDYDGPLRLTSFYIDIRHKYNILMDKNDRPIGGKYTYDKYNRSPPDDSLKGNMKLQDSAERANNRSLNNKRIAEAIHYVDKVIPKENLTCMTDDIDIIFPITHEDAERRLSSFLKNSISDFGSYQDCMLIGDDSFLYHSGLSVCMNVGLIDPWKVIDRTIDYYNSHHNKKTILYAVEGFIRQILGWREFVRYIYCITPDVYEGKNFFNNNNKLTKSWYDATTGIEPVDTCIEKAWRIGYLHHIERLMCVANYMVLSEISPKAMYRWFMEFSLDSYDWVMCANVYSMASYADGGEITTKPYISSSNYILKMSDYPKYDESNKKYEWIDIWDDMFWDFMKKHKNKIKNIYRLKPLLKYA